MRVFGDLWNSRLRSAPQVPILTGPGGLTQKWRRSFRCATSARIVLRPEQLPLLWPCCFYVRPYMQTAGAPVWASAVLFPVVLSCGPHDVGSDGATSLDTATPENSVLPVGLTFTHRYCFYPISATSFSGSRS